MASDGRRALGPLGAVARLGADLSAIDGSSPDDLLALLHRLGETGPVVVDAGGAWQQGESVLGELLDTSPGLRSRIVVAARGGRLPGTPFDASADGLRAACEASMRRLGVAVIDLYQVDHTDLFTHPAELAETLDALVDSGRVRAVGVADYSPTAIANLASRMRAPLTSIGVELSPARVRPFRDGTLDQAMWLETGVLASSPLAGGTVVSGSGIRTDLAVVLDDIAAGHGVDRATVSLAFVLAHPIRPVALLEAATVARLGVVPVAPEIVLDRSDLYRILAASEGEEIR